MMPFESNIQLLATIASKSDKLDGLLVSWTVEGKHQAHYFDKIKIDWELQLKDEANASSQEQQIKQAGTGNAVFHVLDTSSKISKIEVEFIEKKLKEARENADPT
jgi:hypothetical protein